MPNRLTSTIKTAMTFFAKEFASALVTFDPSLKADLSDLPVVSDHTTAKRVYDAYSTAFRTAQDLNTKTSYYGGPLDAAVPGLGYRSIELMFAALQRFADLEGVGWGYCDNTGVPLWSAARRMGCTVERRGDEVRLFAPGPKRGLRTCATLPPDTPLDATVA